MSTTIDLADIKKLRAHTGAGIGDCKKALEATQGDFELALEELRKKGMDKAAKKGGRVAAEGLVMVEMDAQRAQLIELNCETDFVARNQDFVAFSTAISKAAFSGQAQDIETCLNLPFDDAQSIEQARQAMVGKIGENIQIRRLSACVADQGSLTSYIHGTKIAVVVAYTGDEKVARDVAMHITANQPLAVHPEDVDANVAKKEEQRYAEQAAESGKPADIQARMVAGKMKKFLEDVSLMCQPFVKNADVTVAEYLKQNATTIHSFMRLAVGEGIEVKKENFAEEVAKMTEE